MDLGILASTDHQSWRTLVSDAPRPGKDPVAYDLGGVPARWVRIEGRKLAPIAKDGNCYRMQLLEVEVYGASGPSAAAPQSALTSAPPSFLGPPSTPTGPNLALGKTVSASSSVEYHGFYRRALTDGNRIPVANASGWSSSANLRSDHAEWVEVDLGSTYPLDQVHLYPRFDLDPGDGYPLDISILVSVDHQGWSEAVTARNAPRPGKGPVAYSLKGVPARYVRVEGRRLAPIAKDGNAYRMQILELEVYGASSSPMVIGPEAPPAPNSPGPTSSALTSPVAASPSATNELEGAKKLSFIAATEQPYPLPESPSGFSATGTAIVAGGSLGPLSSIAAIRDQAGDAHLLYADWKDSQTITLRYLRQRGTVWESAVIDTIGELKDYAGAQRIDNPPHKPALASGPDGIIHFLWLSTSGGVTTVYHGVLNPESGAFKKTSIDTFSRTDDLVYQMGLGVDSRSVAHVSYYNGGLKYAENSSGAFRSTMLAQDTSTATDYVYKGLDSDLVILPNGDIFIASHGLHERNRAPVAEFLDCQVYEAGSWRNTGVAGSLGAHYAAVLGLHIDSAGRPFVCYSTGGPLGTAFYQDRAWHNQNVATGAAMDRSMTAAVGPDGKVLVTWVSNSGSVLYLSSQTGGNWSHRPLYEYGTLRSTKADVDYPQILPRGAGKAEVYLAARQGNGGVVLQIGER